MISRLQLVDLSIVRVENSITLPYKALYYLNEMINWHFSPQFQSCQRTQTYFVTISLSVTLCLGCTVSSVQKRMSPEIEHWLPIPLERLLTLVIISFHSSYFLLIGHEYPYDIIMNNVQNNLSKSNSKIFTAFPPLPGLFMENQSWDTGGQFILKPRDSAGSQQQGESSTFLHYHRGSHFNFTWNINACCHFFHGRGTVENIP